jgi:hypothetical protein
MSMGRSKNQPSTNKPAVAAMAKRWLPSVSQVTKP